MILYKSLVGSQVYGTATPESDSDYFEITAPENKTKLFCVNGYDHASKQSVSDKIDTHSHDIRKFIKLAISGQSLFLEAINTKPEHHKKVSYFTLWDVREKFLVAQMNLVGPTCGYAQNEYKTALRKNTGKLGRDRKVGGEYSAKNAHHCIRILLQTLFCLETGTYTPYIADYADWAQEFFGHYPTLLYLINLKKGLVALEDFCRTYDFLEKRLFKYHIKGEFRKSALPQKNFRANEIIIENLTAEILGEFYKEHYAKP